MIKAVTGRVEDLEKQKEALKVSKGFPKKNEGVLGPGRHAPIPDTYTPGAGGWDAEACNDPISAGDGTGILLVHEDDLLEDGKTVTVDSETVKIDLVKASYEISELPVKYKDVLTKDTTTTVKTVVK